MVREEKEPGESGKKAEGQLMVEETGGLSNEFRKRRKHGRKALGL